MKPVTGKPWMSVVLVGLWGGCDAQAGAPYQGEPLLTMTGSVELALEVENEEALIPALAFRGDDDVVYLVDAHVDGEFPAEFTLNVYQPPPAASVYALDPETGPGPRVALGYIAAITPDTPERFHLSENEGGSQGCLRNETTGRNVCTDIHTWCTADGSACYAETTVCPDSDNHPDQCTVTGEGDPALKLGLEQRFAGLSENYLVVWLETPAPPRSFLAYLAGERDRGLAQGYHLLAISDASEEVAAAAVVCADEANTLAVQRTNERFGTSYSLDELTSLCSAFDQEDECPEAEIYAELELAQNIAMIELNCSFDTHNFMRVADPANERISVRIGPDLNVL